MTERVVLVHGLWLKAAVMHPLRWQIRRQGFSVERFKYASVKVDLQENARSLSHFLSKLDASTLYIVGHSLGGIVALEALRLREEPRVSRIVLLCSPVGGSAAGRRLASSRAGRWLLGSSFPIWAEKVAPQSPVGIEVGVIAGQFSFGFGRLIVRLPKPNDGVVSVAETQVECAKDSIVLPVSHSAMLVSPAVARAVCVFLRSGSFRQ